MKTIAIWMAVCATCAAGPGELDRKFAPALRAWVAPDHVTIAPDGRAWIGGGFDRGDGKSTGDLLRLGKNGGVAGEPAPGYLGKSPGIGGGYAYVPFPLANGDFLLPGESGGWLRMNSAGQPVGKGFPDRKSSEAVTPLFERAGKLWDIRCFADGRQMLERRRDDRRVDGEFSLAANDVLGAVPGPGDSVWVLAGEDATFNFGGTPMARRVFRADAAGAIIGETRTISVARTVDLVAGPSGAFRLVFGADQSRWNLWPVPTSKTMRIEWYSAAGALERGQDFSLPLFANFAWAESADGSFVATDARRQFPGTPGNFITNSADLRRFGANGAEDAAFQSPGPVRSVKALPDGKWLADGLRRLNPDGSEDTTWTAPKLTRPAEVSALLKLPGGRVLAGGNFATADGKVRNRLVVFRKDRKVDPTFQADERVEEWKSVAVAGNSIYVATTEPIAVTADFHSNLVKLRLDGSLDENFRPQISTGFPVGTRISLGSSKPVTLEFPGPTTVISFPQVYVSKVLPFPNGDILVETYQGGEVASSTIARLHPDGSPVADFQVLHDWPRAFEVMALRSGGYVRGSTIYRRDGKVERDFTRVNVWLRPLCEWLGGVVFLEYSDAPGGRLRLWTGGRWAPWFQPQRIADWHEGVVATRDDAIGLYVSATWTAGRPELRRLTLTGRLDRSFHAPGFGKRERQLPGKWWKAEDGKRVRFDVKAEEIPVSPNVLLWQPATRHLWTGGDFNVADGKPRDGLARLAGGFPWFR